MDLAERAKRVMEVVLGLDCGRGLKVFNIFSLILLIRPSFLSNLGITGIFFSFAPPLCTIKVDLEFSSAAACYESSFSDTFLSVRLHLWERSRSDGRVE